MTVILNFLKIYNDLEEGAEGTLSLVQAGCHSLVTQHVRLRGVEMVLRGLVGKVVVWLHLFEKRLRNYLLRIGRHVVERDGH